MSTKQPYTLWLMGPTSSGKSAVAECFVEILTKNNLLILHYDGDEIRDFFGRNFGFTEENRGMVVKTLVHLAEKANNAGINVIVSALTAHQTARQYTQERLSNLIVTYVDCPIEVCAERDPKGLYKKAKNGEINTLIGYNSVYMPPINPDITLDTNKYSVKENVIYLQEFLKINIH